MLSERLVVHVQANLSWPDASPINKPPIARPGLIRRRGRIAARGNGSECFRKVHMKCLPGLALWEGPRGWNSGLAETCCQVRRFDSATDELCQSCTIEEASQNTDSSKAGSDSLRSADFTFLEVI